jgi:tripartite ATP-independent transporter DctP family solute receptor
MLKIQKYFLPVLLGGCIFLIACGIRKSEDGSVTLKLSHNLSVTHPFNDALEGIAENVAEKSGGKLKIKIFPNSVLGPDRSVLEQLQGNVVEMMKIGSSSTEPFNPLFSIFSLPYLFENEDQFNRVLSGSIIDQINEITTKRDKFRLLTYFTTGVRSFYTIKTPIMKPADLKGLKIRVMESKTSIKMIKLMGGTPTPMPYGEIYTALQQGVIDGAESNPTALTIGKQGEVAKAFSFDEHLMMPDFLIISEDVWCDLSPENQKILQECAREATKNYTVAWNKEVKASIEEARTKMGVKFYYPDKKPFREKVQPLYDEFMKDPLKAKFIKEIQAEEGSKLCLRK